MEIELLSGACGAEIAGINLRDTSNDNIKIIKDLLFEHKVIFFRNQDLTHHEQIVLSKCFGSNVVLGGVSFEVDAGEFLRVYVEKGEDYVKGFSGHVMGQQWNWREVEDIEREGKDAKEEELRILAKGGIIGVGEIEVKKRGK